MIIPCFRCKKPIDTPDKNNADYITASDTIANEAVDVLEAIRLSNGKTVRTEIASIKEADQLPNVERIEATKQVRPVQKTGIVCPECYEPTDLVIWGVHKGG